MLNKSKNSDGDENSSPLFIFELANNHMGDIAHGLRIIDEFAQVARGFPFLFAFKLQYRELDTFIHPDFRDRTDIKYVNRFSETRLQVEEMRRLVSHIKAAGFRAICTPFDEASVDRIVEDGFDALKIASCSLTDWPLLEKIATVDLPIVASTAGVPTPELDNVVAFLTNRQKDLSLMACVAQYPTPFNALELNQIDFLKERYPGLRIGYSTHEDPDERLPIAIAIAKGAQIFEKHVGLNSDQYALNAYSATPEQARHWLEAAARALAICGRCGARSDPAPEEMRSLRELRRGVFLRRAVRAGERIGDADVFFAFPSREGQVSANDWSKYRRYTARADMPENSALLGNLAACDDVRDQVLSIVQRVKSLLKDSKGVVPGEAVLEISHHFGLDRFDEFGATMITVVNRSYCKKLIAMLAGQSHPEQHHKLKEETFHILHGELTLDVDGLRRVCRPGDVVTIPPGARHAFSSACGAVFEEISSTHHPHDSYYTDPTIAANANRKTVLRYWI